MLPLSVSQLVHQASGTRPSPATPALAGSCSETPRASRCSVRPAPRSRGLLITPADQTLLRRAIHIATAAVAHGDAPYGSLLAGPDGTVLAEAHNTVRCDNDISAHLELKPARRAARALDPRTAAGTTP